MIIKTSNPEETKVAAGVRDSLRNAGHTVYLVPKGVEFIHVTVDINEYTGVGQLIIELENMNEDVLDTVHKFDDCDSAYQYARELAAICGLNPDQAVTRDVFDDVAAS